MSKRTAVASLTLLTALLPAPASGADSLAARVEAVLKAPEGKHGRWGVLAVDVAGGKAVYEHNADQLFAPASVTKLYTCAAALIELGAGHRFETPVYRRGPVRGGRLDGDLILLAQGDLTLGGRTDPGGKMTFKDDDHIYANGPGPRAAVTDTDPLAGLKELARQVKAAGVREVRGDVLVDDRLFEQARGTGSGPDSLTPTRVDDNVVGG